MRLNGLINTALFTTFLATKVGSSSTNYKIKIQNWTEYSILWYMLKQLFPQCVWIVVSLSSTSDTNTDTDVFTSILILVPGISKR
jgi:hypothetical protein